MKMIVLSIVFTIFINAPANAKGQLVATPINSPVKESHLVVKLDGITDLTEVLFKPKNGGNEVPGSFYKEAGIIFAKFKVSMLSPGTYHYRIRTRSASGGSEKEQSSTIAFISFVIDPSLGVADPGEEGKKTLLGIDSNENGVRDDVERWINESEKDENIKRAMIEKSKAMQLTFVNKDNKEMSVFFSRQSLKAQDCLRYLMRSRGSTTREIVEMNINMLSHMANTRQRIISKEKVSSNFHGQVVSRIPQTQACQF